MGATYQGERIERISPLLNKVPTYDKIFEIKHVRIPKRTAELLPANVLGGFQKKGMKVVRRKTPPNFL